MSVVDRPGPVVIAHRGGCALGPENTIAAFDIGMATGADGLELDVHLASDGVPVVLHDETLDRTTDSTGPVFARTAGDLARVDAGYRFKERDSFPFRGQHIGIPTLREVLERYPATFTTIEMKGDSAALGAAVAREVLGARALDRVCVAGFGARTAAAARSALGGVASSACLPEVRGALYRSWVRWPLGPVPYVVFQVPEIAGRLRVVSRRFVRHAHRSGVRVHVWVVNEEQDMRRLLDWGVDGLITDRPDLAVSVRDSWLRHK